MKALHTCVVLGAAAAVAACGVSASRLAAQQRDPARPAERDQERTQDRSGRAATQIRGRTEAGAQAGSFLQASTLIGMQVQAAESERIGVVKDVLIDPRTCVQYILLDTRGVVDVDGFVVVPWPLFEFQTAVAARDTSFLLLSVPVARLRTAPIVSSTRVDLAFTAPWVNEVTTFFDAELKERRTARPDLDAPDQPNRPGARDPNDRSPQPRPRTPRTDDPPRRDPQPGSPPRTPRTPPGSDDPPGSRQPQPPEREPQPRTPQPEDRPPSENPNP